MFEGYPLVATQVGSPGGLPTATYVVPVARGDH
jgi:hypothetical protein